VGAGSSRAPSAMSEGSVKQIAYRHLRIPVSLRKRAVAAVAACVRPLLQTAALQDRRSTWSPIGIGSRFPPVSRSPIFTTAGPAAVRPRYSARPDLPRDHGRDALANSMRTRATAATIPGGGFADLGPPCSARKDVLSSQRLGQHCRVGADRVLAGRVPSGCTAGTNASLSILCLRGHSRDPDLLSPTRRARSSDRQPVAC
jgi:hypothetical protein